MQRAGHEDKIKGVPGFESWGFRDNQHDKWNVCRSGSFKHDSSVRRNPMRTVRLGWAFFHEPKKE